MLPSSARVTGFIPTLSYAEAKAFYGGVLGLKLVVEEPYALVFDSGGVTLRIVRVEAFTPHPFTLLGWEVPDVRASVAGLAAKGVSFLRYDWMEQDPSGIWEAPGGVLVAWFQDPDGNVLSLSSPE